jgi:Nuclease-related domain
MILKELDSLDPKGKFEIAGRRAEEQMAFYLRRFFGSSVDVDVLNYLRIDLKGEVAQMDHLVLHPYGLLIVESKSVSDSVQIADDGQWKRWFNRKPSGMPSPITQAKMQAALLKELLEKTVKQKGFFDQVRLDVLVAISDGGTIQWPASGALPEVCKADQIPDRINQRVDQFRRVRQDPEILTSKYRLAIADFLLKVHKPLERFKQSDPASLKVEEPPAIYVMPLKETSITGLSATGTAGLPPKKCKHCGGTSVDVRHGQFGYYFHCAACEKNTAIKFSCPACRGEGRVRKQGNDFFAECKSCSASSLYYSNRA